jgi:hypothetical protein
LIRLQTIWLEASEDITQTTKDIPGKQMTGKLYIQKNITPSKKLTIENGKSKNKTKNTAGGTSPATDGRAGLFHLVLIACFF